MDLRVVDADSKQPIAGALSGCSTSIGRPLCQTDAKAACISGGKGELALDIPHRSFSNGRSQLTKPGVKQPENAKSLHPGDTMVAARWSIKPASRLPGSRRFGVFANTKRPAGITELICDIDATTDADSVISVP